ncbi:MAG: hypothetical protein CL868_01835 [Cytophagaceae bacterium]|nr:hypothetical protein [Cytophagaceae bacterium]|tara:strand:+ start:3112 stop:5145 length:2034 start_codon:yes stop_codon:yes gene_type:complete
MNLAYFPGLQIDTAYTKSDALNFKPESWPPAPDFPVVIDAYGDIVSRYGDVRWDLSAWAGHTLTIYFGDGPGQGKKVSPANAELLRKIVAWWLWGEAAIRSPKALVYKFETIKPLFVACTDAGILATELYRFPKIIENLGRYYKQRSNRLIECLHSLFISRDVLGFSVIDESGIKLLSSVLTTTDSTQTAYIPVRIWSYQISRLKECLDDFLLHQQKIEACFEFCLSAYARNAGGDLSNAFGGLRSDAPFRKSRGLGDSRSGKVFYGSFQETAEEYEISDLLSRWVLFNDSTGIRAISTYLTMISNVGLAYILNFSLMRVEEGSRLRANCYEIEPNQLGDEIHTLKGVTTKTIEDNDARWIVSPTTEIAVKAMRAVAKLRLKAAKHNPHLRLTKDDIENPLLQSLAHEPWSPKAPRSKSIKAFKKIRSYGDVWNMWPKLFNESKLRITEADVELANRMTFGLDPEKYSVGKIWPLSWHQLRRTGAVNMLASGLVTEASLQYQLKHASRAMSQYYGKNFYRLKEPLNASARDYYLREMYQSMVREFKALQSDQHFSPFGKAYTHQIINEISEKDHVQLLKAAKKGQLSYRQTFLGGCANSGPPCPLGGISNISSCMGYGNNKPCASVLLDKAKLPMIKQLKNVLNTQLIEASPSSPLYESLKSQLESAERAIYAIENK